MPVQVRADCMEGHSHWLPPTPPEHWEPPDRAPLPVQMGETLEFRVRAGGSAIGLSDGLVFAEAVGFNVANVDPPLGPDRCVGGCYIST